MGENNGNHLLHDTDLTQIDIILTICFQWITQNGYKLRQNLATFVARQKAKENKK